MKATLAAEKWWRAFQRTWALPRPKLLLLWGCGWCKHLKFFILFRLWNTILSMEFLQDIERLMVSREQERWILLILNIYLSLSMNCSLSSWLLSKKHRD